MCEGWGSYRQMTDRLSSSTPCPPPLSYLRALPRCSSLLGSGAGVLRGGQSMSGSRYPDSDGLGRLGSDDALQHLLLTHPLRQHAPRQRPPHRKSLHNKSPHLITCPVRFEQVLLEKIEYYSPLQHRPSLRQAHRGWPSNYLVLPQQRALWSSVIIQLAWQWSVVRLRGTML